MQTTQYLSQVINELKRTANLMVDGEAEKIVEAILNAKKIFVVGAGRSGFMGKSFAMRLMHMNLDVYVIGETVTPNLEKDDLLIIGSGSGETNSLLSMAAKAKGIGATVALVTIFPESSIGKVADIAVKISAQAKAETVSELTTIQPMGSLFEQSLLLFYDSLILRFMERKELDSSTMFTRHANLE
ncbi:6-phospho-3-hexuloisomerase [Gracilibacillus sp. YIM 98692]|uniref:6-phospho-3-hexuloisomerase n=1 Tax=Gracilibacillus sp. YIM 98692 TaxID=2663532 RepID=UPI0013D74ABF|nr:6-phospho-3-hexuloisomerase [Gracilibacillus sp. YIM 98692]